MVVECMFVCCQVNVPTPDYGGRREILELYLARVRAHAEVDCDVLARGTTGFTGADLENMVNQAALKSVHTHTHTITFRSTQYFVRRHTLIHSLTHRHALTLYTTHSQSHQF